MTDSEQIWKEYHDSLDNRNKLKDDLAASEIRFKKVSGVFRRLYKSLREDFARHFGNKY